MSTIVSIHSYRGGTGKSNLTANLASSIVQKGKRVAVVDTDLQSPGLHVLFGMSQQQEGLTLNDYLYGRCSIEQTVHEVTGKSGSDGTTQGALFLLPASIKAGEITRMLREGYEVNLLTDGFRKLMKTLRLDYLFIDTHPGLNEETLLSLAISDALVLILRPDQQDFQGTAVTVEVARKLEVPRMLLVINKVLTSLDFAALRQRVEHTYNTTVAGIFPLSEELLLASSGVFSLHYPDHAFTREVQKVARQITS